MGRFIIITLTIIILVGCEALKGTKTMDFGKFTIEVPVAWKKKKLWIDDSYVGGIVMESGDMAVFDLGLYSNDLEDIDSLTHDVEWKLMDGRNAKFVIAKGASGYTGIYIDSLWTRGTFGEYSMIEGFQMGASDLSAEDKQRLKSALMTLKFYGDHR
jgi:hypothetical protein